MREKKIEIEGARDREIERAAERERDKVLSLDSNFFSRILYYFLGFRGHFLDFLSHGFEMGPQGLKNYFQEWFPLGPPLLASNFPRE